MELSEEEKIYAAKWRIEKRKIYGLTKKDITKMFEEYLKKGSKEDGKQTTKEQRAIRS